MDAALPWQSLTLMELSLHVAELARQLHAADEADAAGSSEVREFILNHLAARIATLGIRLSDLGHREQALAASQEAVDIYRRLAETRPDAFLPDLAMSLNNLGNRLSNLGRREQALAASQEAVDIRRPLAETRPDAFLPYLARSIIVHSDALAALDQAAQAAAEALRILFPFVERYPETFGELARKVMADIQRYSDAAGQAPDQALLARAAQVLGSPQKKSEQ
jgi:tetratricopeptide (TPR) repeat protein